MHKHIITGDAGPGAAVAVADPNHAFLRLASTAVARHPVATKEDAPAIDRGAEDEHHNFAADGANSKAVATMTAKAAQAGCTLHQLAGGGFLLCKWGMAKELPCLRAVGDMLRRIGGRHG